MDLAPLGERPLGSAPVVMDLVGPLQEAQEAERGAGSGNASPDQGARQLLPELSPYTYRRPLGAPRTPRPSRCPGRGGRAADGLPTCFRRDSGFAFLPFERIADGIGYVSHLVANSIGGMGHLVAEVV